jgi:hypothetical protein
MEELTQVFICRFNLDHCILKTYSEELYKIVVLFPFHDNGGFMTTVWGFVNESAVINELSSEYLISEVY